MNILKQSILLIIFIFLGGCSLAKKAPVGPTTAAAVRAVQLLPKDCPARIAQEAAVRCQQAAVDAGAKTRQDNVNRELGGTGIGAGVGAVAGGVTGAVTPRYGGYYYGYYRGNHFGQGLLYGAALGSIAGGSIAYWQNPDPQAAADAEFEQCYLYYQKSCDQAIAAQLQKNLKATVAKKKSKKRR